MKNYQNFCALPIRLILKLNQKDSIIFTQQSSPGAHLTSVTSMPNLRNAFEQYFPLHLLHVKVAFVGILLTRLKNSKNYKLKKVISNDKQKQIINRLQSTSSTSSSSASSSFFS